MLKLRLLAVGLFLIHQCLSQEIKIQLESQHHSKHHHHHFSTGTVDETTLKATTDNSKPWLNDLQLTTPLKLGTKSVTAVLDSTSYVTWVMSGDPTSTSTQACIGCPAESTLFHCEEPTCKPQLDKENQKIAYRLEKSYGGRVKGQGHLAVESYGELQDYYFDKLHFGLQHAFEEASKPFLIKSHGALGLGFGESYQEYIRDSSKQVDPEEYDPQKDPSLSILMQIKRTNRDVKSAAWSLKLEDDLKLLKLGDAQNYFADESFTFYENVGEKYWALNLEQFKFGTASITGLKETIPQHESSEVGISLDDQNKQTTVPEGLSGAAAAGSTSGGSTSGGTTSGGSTTTTTTTTTTSSGGTVSGGTTTTTSSGGTVSGGTTTTTSSGGTVSGGTTTTTSSGGSTTTTSGGSTTSSGGTTTTSSGGSTTTTTSSGGAAGAGASVIPEGLAEAAVAAHGEPQHPPSSHDAVFDTTTRFVWVDSTIQDKVKGEIKTLLGKDCVSGGAGDVLKCPCESETDVEKFPSLSFSFNKVHNKHFKIANKNYILFEKQQNSCFVLIRQYAANGMARALGHGDKDAVVLPYTFFYENYGVFNQDSNKISLARGYQVAPDPLHLEQTTQWWVLIVGLLLFFIALALLLALLKQINLDFEGQPVQSYQPAGYDQSQFQAQGQIQQQSHQYNFQGQSTTIANTKLQAQAYQQVQYNQQLGGQAQQVQYNQQQGGQAQFSQQLTSNQQQTQFIQQQIQYQPGLQNQVLQSANATVQIPAPSYSGPTQSVVIQQGSPQRGLTPSIMASQQVRPGQVVAQQFGSGTFQLQNATSPQAQYAVR